MYRPKHFTETDRVVIKQFMEGHPFVTLIASDGQQPVATQIPVMVEERDGQLYIQGHISRHTDHYTVLEKNPNALILFSGAHTYISASWYSKRGQASTWDYMNVQAGGSVQFFDDEKATLLLKKLTNTYELGQAKPELIENMSESYVVNNTKAIAAFEMEVKDLNATFKLSQNRDDESYQTIVQQLSISEDSDAQKIAVELKKRRPHLF